MEMTDICCSKTLMPIEYYLRLSRKPRGICFTLGVPTKTDVDRHPEHLIRGLVFSARAKAREIVISLLHFYSWQGLVPCELRCATLVD